VICVDTNILVYAHRPEGPFHESARDALRGLAEGARRWAIPGHCLVEFTGVVTHARLWKAPSSPSDVESQIAAWFESPSLRVLAEEGDFWKTFLDVVRESQVRGSAVHDARIAATCRFHGVTELWTADRDFGRYPWLPARNPLLV
jgi:toxin-antitoxin system PIN domain toxin